MAVLTIRTNEAIDINPPSGQQYLSEHGSDWLWAATAVYIVSFIGFFALTFLARAGEKVFHYIFTVALFVGSIAYYAMASDLGWSVVSTANTLGEGLTRQIFFAKYINWVVGFPSLILAFGLLSGVAWATMVYNVFLSWIWIISYLVSAYTVTNYKWGFYAFGTIAYLLLAWNTLFEGLAGAKRVGVVRDYSMLASWLNFMWLLYPIAYGLSDGGNKITVTSGFIFFGILDILTVPLLSFAFLIMSRNWDYGKLNIAFTQYGRVRVAGTFPEKEAAATPAVGGVTGEQAA